MKIQKRLKVSYIILIIIPLFLFISASFFLRELYVIKLTKIKLSVQTKEFNNYLYSTLGSKPDNFLKEEHLLELISKTQHPEFTSAHLDIDGINKIKAGAIKNSNMDDFIDQKYLNYWFFNLEDGTFAELYLIDRTFTPEKFPVGLLIPIIFYMILISSLSYYTSRTITKPLKQLEHAANSIREEDFDIDLNYSGDDEFGSAFSAFDNMRIRLKHIVQQQLKYENNRIELISNISHDLKTPITAIKGYIEGLRDGVANTPEKVERYHSTIYKKVNLLDKMIENLFLYSKLDLKTMPFNFKRLDIKLFLEDIVDEVKYEKPEININFTHENAPVYISADPIHLQRVIHNIISNSIKYNNKEKCIIDIKLIKENNSVRLSFSDNGIGISQNNSKKIFDRFYRSDPARSSEKDGSGLGLAISKQIIEEHRGEIFANSNLLEGMTITFVLPIKEEN